MKQISLERKYIEFCVSAGVEINTGPLARGQWISCWASRICFALARLASKILEPHFWVYKVECWF